jgi:hypothetical protein
MTFRRALIQSDASVVAFGPPISVFIQPGCIAAARIPSFFKSMLRFFVIMLRAA